MHWSALGMIGKLRLPELGRGSPCAAARLPSPQPGAPAGSGEGGRERSREGPEPWPSLVPSTCDSCMGASRRLLRLGRRGRPAGAAGAPGRARACQRDPSFIYDVRPMSLSAGLLGAGCGQRLDRELGPPTWLLSPAPGPAVGVVPLGPTPLHVVSATVSCVSLPSLASLSLSPGSLSLLGPCLHRPFPSEPPGLSPPSPCPLMSASLALSQDLSPSLFFSALPHL